MMRKQESRDKQYFSLATEIVKLITAIIGLLVAIISLLVKD